MSGDDTGSGTVLTLGVVGAVVTALVTALSVTGALRAAHQARGAADLAALAAAHDSSVGAAPAQVCATARDIAERNGARVVGCDVTAGSVVTIETAVAVPLRLGGLVPEMTGHARAGPAPDS